MPFALQARSRPSTDRRPALRTAAQQRQRAFHLLHRAVRRRGIEVALVVDDDVGELDDALLHRLQVVARVRKLHQHEDVGQVGDVGLALPHADRLDDHDVESRRFDEQHRLARVRGDAAQRAARGRRPDERVRVARRAPPCASCRRAPSRR